MVIKTCKAWEICMIITWSTRVWWRMVHHRVSIILINSLQWVIISLVNLMKTTQTNWSCLWVSLDSRIDQPLTWEMEEPVQPKDQVQHQC